MNIRLRRAQRGVSLIEVLVVLVILVTGILTIIRLFPSGFFSIQSAGNSGVANNLGGAAINAGAQNSESLPDAILPDNLTGPGPDDLSFAMSNSAANSSYDPDNPNNFENARVIGDETITVPTVSNGQSIYPVLYGPIAVGTPSMPLNPKTSSALQLSAYMTVNSLPWSIQSGSSVTEANPKDLLNLDQPNYLVDYTNGQIAFPYAAYSRDFVMTIIDANNAPHTLYLTVPKEHAVDSTAGSTYLYGPVTNDKLAYQVSEAADYNGNWFDPIDSTLNYVTSPAQPIPAIPKPWISVSVYRPFNWIQTGGSFSNDPYEFQLASGNIGTTYANTGAVAFNPLGGGANGLPSLKARLSYLTCSWNVLHEDHDIPALTGSGSTAVVRTAVPNLLRAGSANPDNSINPGILGSNDSLIVMDLDTGQIIAPGTDPTLLNDEDTNGTVPNSPSTINVSYSLGRLTFGSNAFGDNSSATPIDGTGTAPAHRIRVFYTADLNWTVAVQKAPSYFSQLVTSPVGTATGTTALAANQYAYDSTGGHVYFARCNAGKTVEIDGTYTSGGMTQGFSDTIAIDPTLGAVGDTAVSVGLTDGTKVQQPVPTGATGTVTFTAVRGLSARAVVAWKERNQWKVHSVDALLNRTP